jgi:hypothetical protein
VKAARPVLRGLGRSNASELPDYSYGRVRDAGELIQIIVVVQVVAALVLMTHGPAELWMFAP